MSDALERVRAFEAQMGGPIGMYPPDDEGERVWLNPADLRAVCAELTALRGARSWERWAVVDDSHPAFVYVGLSTMNRLDAEQRATGPGERVIRVRITEIPEVDSE